MPGHQDRVIVIRGDITRQRVDAIVNAANAALIPGGGVHGAFHRAAGPGLFQECQKLGGCPPGEARITGGYNLPARWVIHTVGPIWRGGNAGERQVLAQCYRSCLDMSVRHEFESLAFPSISTGAFGYPVEEASAIALRGILSHFEAEARPKRVIVVCFDAVTHRAYLEAMASRENP